MIEIIHSAKSVIIRNKSDLMLFNQTQIVSDKVWSRNAF